MVNQQQETERSSEVMMELKIDINSDVILKADVRIACLIHFGFKQWHNSLTGYLIEQ